MLNLSSEFQTNVVVLIGKGCSGEIVEILVQHVDGDVSLFSVFVPTNHVYVGDVFLLGT